MHTFEQLTELFGNYFSAQQLPTLPKNLYDPCRYFLQLGGKRIRPVFCLMGNELFGEIHEDAYKVGTAIELFHNFTLIHDDIMDEADLRRGKPTVHTKYGNTAALLSGDVMMIKAYQYLENIQTEYLKNILHLFNKTAVEVCEGQQLDMDYAQDNRIDLYDYIKMIELKTSVLLAASLEMGAIIGGASEGSSKHLYAFGKNLGIAFQIQDDYLDAFGDAAKFGKEIGGDIKQNKKTALLIRALEVATDAQKLKLNDAMNNNADNKVETVIQLFRECGVPEWAKALKEEYLNKAMYHLEEVAVQSSRKKHLKDIAAFLIQRDY
ncbi:polyprenyl synthetase family protein [Hydrotalea sandarakina]|jgi:geranylgeranyl diphosphate synthase type II|uniref:Geranylgeranyl diphosphate synthase type II n=1 Tax=Hydrotalea sandarakina TaxID=1004304 RepID=A0A2W7S038_9BACT|nr:polyprenyl synthetase family protein [Hydrotalea sandarakina]PZX65884.1 geranylgeranyl diphosphate synthase type II [Hydrotalea sandarakina]